MSAEPLTVRVDLGARSYDIVIGDNLLASLKDRLAPFIGGAKLHIVTDENVYRLHGSKLSNLEHSLTILPPGESQKSFEVLQKVLDDAFSNGLARGDIFIAFGGGVIGDLTGFAAAVYKRGCRFIQIPTTLLAQVDSSVGGKTAINVKQGKNLVGAFYQPELVLADTAVLKTLPERQVKAGYAEILKYGLLGNFGFFEWLENNAQDVIALRPDAIAHAVAVSCRMKAAIVAEDERETGARALLNLGHTFAHALEAEAGYGGDLLHGEAVSIGMDMAFEFSARAGLCPSTAPERIKAHLDQTQMPRIDAAASLLKPAHLIRHMGQDKKNQGGKLTLILARAIGEAFIDKDADSGALFDYLEKTANDYA